MQMLYAMEIERHYAKSQILEAYFNLAPYGGNIEGIGAASEIYFGKAPSKLTLPEAVALSVIPQSPSKRALHRDSDNRRAPPRRDGCSTGSIRPPAAGSFRAHAEMDRRFWRRISRRGAPDGPGHGKSQRLWTWVCSEWSSDGSKIMSRPTGSLGITNAAVMLVDFQTMEVLAGSRIGEFFRRQNLGPERRHDQQPLARLDVEAICVCAGDGPGLDSSVEHSQGRTAQFWFVQPENFDREFTGPIRAVDALTRSRNIPAVELASRLSHPTLYEFLKQAGVDLGRTRNSTAFRCRWEAPR